MERDGRVVEGCGKERKERLSPRWIGMGVRRAKEETVKEKATPEESIIAPVVAIRPAGIGATKNPRDRGEEGEESSSVRRPLRAPQHGAAVIRHRIPRWCQQFTPLPQSEHQCFWAAKLTGPR
jgi:hypothetical protein